MVDISYNFCYNKIPKTSNKTIKVIIKNINQHISIEYASKLLLRGETVAIPTETVYGLAADMTNHMAVNKIYSIKNRPINHPLIVHIANKEDLAVYCTKIPNYVTELINNLWPGPITFILHKTSNVPNYVTGTQNTVAIRMPCHKLALKLIDTLGKPIVAPSANRFKGVSPTRPEHVIDEFGEEINVLDGGICENGLESTIIDATQENYYKILRPGSVTSEDIDLILREKHSHVKCISNINNNLAFPGNYLKHYSPKKALITFFNKSDLEVLNKSPNRFYVIHYSFELPYNNFNYYKMSQTPEEFARQFYHALRLGDNSDCDAIAIESPPNDSPKWHAIWDRLNKAMVK